MEMEESLFTKVIPSFDATFFRMEVTLEYVIITKADGDQPGIYFYDHDLNRLKFFWLFKLNEAPYNLALHTDENHGFL